MHMKRTRSLLLLLLVWGGLQAQTTEPLLVLNTPMHTAIINRISTDATGQFLVTSSDDKTARIWDANTGNLINTFHPPIGIGNDGLLYACALSPDGQTCAVAGWTTHNEIFLFNATNGVSTISPIRPTTPPLGLVDENLVTTVNNVLANEDSARSSSVVSVNISLISITVLIKWMWERGAVHPFHQINVSW